jgi:hypothetical protein
MNDIKYLLDENVHPALRFELYKRETELILWEIGDPGTPPKSAKDSDILVWCEENGFILITNNRKSMPRHLKDHLNAGRHSPGIFILNNKMGIRDTVEELLIIREASFPNEYRDLIIHLPLITRRNKNMR